MLAHKYFVLVSACVIYGLNVGLVYSLGTLFDVIMTTFNVSRAKASTIQSVYMGVELGGGIVYGILTGKLGPSKAAMIGTTATSVGFISSFWATSLSYLLAASVLAGMGCGMSLIGCTTSVRSHFSGKTGAVALSIVLTSSGSSAFLLTYILRYLSMEYGLRGTLLILGGIHLNCVALSRLLKRNNYQHKYKRGLLRLTRTAIMIENTTYISQITETNPDTASSNSISENDTPRHSDKKRESSSPRYSSIKTDNIKDATDLEHANKTTATQLKKYSNNDSVRLVSECRPSIDQGNDDKRHSLLTTLDSSVAKTDEFHHNKHQQNGLQTEVSSLNKLKTILQLPSFMFTILMIVLSFPSVFVYQIFIIDIFADAGFTPDQGSIALMIMNICSLCGRASPAVLAHCPVYNPFVFPVTTGLISAAGMILFIFVEGLHVNYVLCSVIGLHVGVVAATGVVIVSLIVDPKYLAEAIGVQATLSGGFGLTAGPLTGFLRDISGSYSIPHVISASFVVLGSLALYIASRWYQKQ